VLTIVILLFLLGTPGAALGWYWGTRAMRRRTYDALGPAISDRPADGAERGRRRRQRVVMAMSCSLASMAIGLTVLTVVANA